MILPVAFKYVKGNAMADILASRGMASSRTATAHPSLAARIGAAVAVWRQRRTLAELPDHLRQDLGLTETQIQQELRRPVWVVPQYWRF
ncbi:DUF1127 domain-containing protein [Roseibacterium sp. SDUM158017]|uniref:DUF1127 domain-containing protein n=1 Tax=Roseicyclus salinarum TaxID=3036773 RepID=UPI002415268F|nr:DUF1127 domain-containing protein [Roseibacterium sp. SDUM158017]MDG4649316.1 DUF1127 domain-containing protein [Roseibacterium sp. SDUM158017]